MGEAIKEIIKAIKEMPNFLLFVLITISLNILFWFVSIFLFHKGFYHSNPIAIVVIFCVALAIVWFVLSLALGALSIYNKQKSKQKLNPDMVTFVSGFTSLFLLLITMFGSYIYRSYNPITYNDFLKFLFAWMFISLLRTLILFGIKSSREEKEKTEASNKVDKELAEEFKKGFEEIIRSNEDALKKTAELNKQIDDLKNSVG